MNINGFVKARQIANAYRAIRKMPEVTARKATEERGELYLYEPIGAGFFSEGLTGKTVADQLTALKGVKQLDIYVNSEGGNVFDGMAIYNTIKRFEARKIAHVDGLAASAASFVVMAADTIKTSGSATWMIHEAHGFGGGGAEDFRQLADVLEMENQSIARLYAQRTGKPVGELLSMMNDEKWFSGEDAVLMRFADEVEDGGSNLDLLAARSKDMPIAAVAAQAQAEIGRYKPQDLMRAKMENRTLRLQFEKNRASPGQEKR